MLHSNNCLSLGNLSLFATDHVCVGMERSELSTSVSELVYSKAATLECSCAWLVLGAATKKIAAFESARNFYDSCSYGDGYTLKLYKLLDIKPCQNLSGTLTFNTELSLKMGLYLSENKTVICSR